MQRAHREQVSMENSRSWSIPFRVGRLVLIGVALGSMLLLSASLGSTRLQSPTTTAAAIPTPTPPCTQDIECSDNVFCNGIERCSPEQPGADARGCVAAVPPSPCNVRQECEEATRRCVIAGCADADHDGDGHRSIRCGGDDCDDRDANRFPGRMEVCDAEGHDEDCNPQTYGDRDFDGDGEIDVRCCNREVNGTLHCGIDYDDKNPAVRVGSMICDGPDAVVVFFSGPSSLPCPAGTNCVKQPNETGICMVPPAGYVPPGRFKPPAEPAPLPALGTLISSENITPIRPGATGPTSTEQTSVSSVTVAPTVVSAATAGGSAAEVAECKSMLQSGKISWGGGTSWAPGNIDLLCNGTKNAKETIACFQSSVEALGWAKAIDKCK